MKLTLPALMFASALVPLTTVEAVDIQAANFEQTAAMPYYGSSSNYNYHPVYNASSYTRPVQNVYPNHNTPSYPNQNYHNSNYNTPYHYGQPTQYRPPVNTVPVNNNSPYRPNTVAPAQYCPPANGGYYQNRPTLWQSLTAPFQRVGTTLTGTVPASQIKCDPVHGCYSY